MMKKILIPWLVTFFVMFGLSGLFNSLIIRGFVEESILPQMLKSPPDMVYIIVGYLLLSLLMTLLYPKLSNSNNKPIQSGLLFGFFISILWLLPVSLVLHGVYNFPTTALIIDSSWALVEQGLGGVAIGVCYKYFS